MQYLAGDIYKEQIQNEQRLNANFAQSGVMMSFMDVVCHVCHSVLLKLCENIEGHIMLYLQLEIGYKCSSDCLKCGMRCSSQIYIPLCSCTYEISLEESES